MRLLGGGSAYEAYLAFDEVTYAPVVVKVVRPDQVADELQPARPAPRGRGAGRGQPPGGRARAAADVEGPRPHVVLEHIDGPRLSTLVRRYGPLQEQQYLPLAIEIASALHYFRATSGYVHLDIKPSNIIMGAPARLIDLCVARTVDEAAGLDLPDRHRRLHGARAVRAPDDRDAGHRQRRVGPRRHAVRGDRRLPGVRRGRPACRRAGGPLPAARLGAVRAARPGPGRGRRGRLRRLAPTPRTGRCRTRSPRPSSRCSSASPSATLAGFKAAQWR